MTRDEIITALYKSKFIENYARQFCGVADIVYFDDIVAELYLIVCELPAARLQRIHREGGIEGVRGYVSGIITKQMVSTNSRVYRLYTRHVYRQQATDPQEWPHEKEDTSASTPSIW